MTFFFGGGRAFLGALVAGFLCLNGYSIKMLCPQKCYSSYAASWSIGCQTRVAKGLIGNRMEIERAQTEFNPGSSGLAPGVNRNRTGVERGSIEA